MYAIYGTTGEDNCSCYIFSALNGSPKWQMSFNVEKCKVMQLEKEINYKNIT